MTDREPLPIGQRVQTPRGLGQVAGEPLRDRDLEVPVLLDRPLPGAGPGGLLFFMPDELQAVLV